MERNTAIDNVKGLGIILMVLGHSSIPHPLYNAIFTFHMPLFFILSGYLYKKRALADVIKNNFQKVMKPYLWCLLLCTPVCFYLYRYDWLLTCIFTKNVPPICGFNWDGYIGPLWFLFAYFNTMIALTLIKRVWSKYLAGIILVFLFEVSLLCSQKYHSILPFQLFQTTGCLVFAYIGYVGKEVVPKLMNHKLNVAVCIPLFAIIAHYGYLSMASFEYRLNLLQFVGGVCGTVLLYYFVKIFKIGRLAIVGRYSMPIFCFHSIDYHYRGG